MATDSLIGPESPKESKIYVEDELWLPHPLDCPMHPITLRREHYLRTISNLIREKENWWEKLENPRIRAKWVRQAKQIYINQVSKGIIDKEDLEFVFKELRECYRPLVNAIIQPAIDCVWKSDILIPEELRRKLLEEVSILENVPESEKDWHPGSNKQVLDLVHPSLFPLVYDRSMDIKSGKVIPADPPGGMDVDSKDNPYSLQFQWLPSDFKIAEDGSTRIESYINNLSSEKHRGLYPVLENIFSRFVPMFNNVLSEIREGRDRFRRVNWPKVQEGQHVGEFKPNKPDSDDEDEDSSDENNIYEVKHKDEDTQMDEFEIPEEERDEYKSFWEMGDLSGDRFTPPVLTETLNGKTVKVIVKLANIILTPENPEYSGGSWHVEGMLNERIIATGIYYYDQENITGSQLRFRSLIEVDEYISGPFAQAVLGVEWEGTSVQEIGHVETKKNRSIVFPNIFQHCVSKFKLQDRSKPGFRKILVFFLCDPYLEDIISTSSVAPQQASFLDEQVAAMRECDLLGALPEEVFQLIINNLPPVISLEDAKDYREKLMNERKRFILSSEQVQGIEYNLCEH